MRSRLYNLILPILYVKDLQVEKKFYLDLGFKVSYEGKEFPNFVGIKYGKTIEFGLEQKKNINVRQLNQAFVWQIGTNSLKKLLQLARAKNITILQPPKPVIEQRNLWEVHLQSPNGYTVIFEGPNDLRINNQG